MGEKLDFAVRYGNHLEPVKARIFQGVDGATYARIEGDLFNDCESSEDRLTQLIKILQDVRQSVRACSGVSGQSPDVAKR